MQSQPANKFHSHTVITQKLPPIASLLQPNLRSTLPAAQTEQNEPTTSASLPHSNTLQNALPTDYQHKSISVSGSVVFLNKNSLPQISSSTTEATNDAIPQGFTISYPIIESCLDCRFKCPTKVSEANRESINKSFWKLEWSERRMFVARHVISQPTSLNREVPKRTKTRRTYLSYFLLGDDGTYKQVCKIFFLTTLGFSPTNDSVVRETMKDVEVLNSGQPRPDKRGKTKNPKTEERCEFVKRHVLTYDRGDKKLKVKSMHADFVSRYPDRRCSYQYYREIVHAMDFFSKKNS